LAQGIASFANTEERSAVRFSDASDAVDLVFIPGGAIAASCSAAGFG